mmetsp:Transcript_82269/g.266667  ORF Transcript_82269/g.266667 Transcript_82269/m.266667 type:complete len:438 (-) Transcript_82269:91-1404(-)
MRLGGFGAGGAAMPSRVICTPATPPGASCLAGDRCCSESAGGCTSVGALQWSRSIAGLNARRLEGTAAQVRTGLLEHGACCIFGVAVSDERGGVAATKAGGVAAARTGGVAAVSTGDVQAVKAGGVAATKVGGVAAAVAPAATPASPRPPRAVGLVPEKCECSSEAGDSKMLTPLGSLLTLHGQFSGSGSMMQRAMGGERPVASSLALGCSSSSHVLSRNGGPKASARAWALASAFTAASGWSAFSCRRAKAGRRAPNAGRPSGSMERRPSGMPGMEFSLPTRGCRPVRPRVGFSGLWPHGLACVLEGDGGCCWATCMAEALGLSWPPFFGLEGALPGAEFSWSSLPARGCLAKNTREALSLALLSSAPCCRPTACPRCCWGSSVLRCCSRGARCAKAARCDSGSRCSSCGERSRAGGGDASSSCCRRRTSRNSPSQ